MLSLKRSLGAQTTRKGIARILSEVGIDAAREALLSTKFRDITGLQVFPVVRGDQPRRPLRLVYHPVYIEKSVLDSSFCLALTTRANVLVAESSATQLTKKPGPEVLGWQALEILEMILSIAQYHSWQLPDIWYGRHEP
ncbi:MAG: hypothetical protein PHR51_00320 [Patescibacteria group bacterium]|nr:hypothetical protein [Patescibacteria group bacterium]